MHTPYCFHCETREVEAPFTYADGSGFCSAECEDAANNVESSYSYEVEEPFDRDLYDDEAALESVYGPTDDGSGWLDEGWYE
jgi:hypothetical protein